MEEIQVVIGGKTASRVISAESIEALAPLLEAYPKVFLVYDRNVAWVAQEIAAACPPAGMKVLDASEKAKDMATVLDLKSQRHGHRAGPVRLAARSRSRPQESAAGRGRGHHHGPGRLCRLHLPARDPLFLRAHHPAGTGRCRHRRKNRCQLPGFQKHAGSHPPTRFYLRMRAGPPDPPPPRLPVRCRRAPQDLPDR